MGNADGDLPKPMVRIGAFPLVAHIIQNFESQGFRDFILAGGYKIDTLITYFANWDSHRVGYFANFSDQDSSLPRDSAVRIIWTGDDTNTGGRIHNLEAILSEYSEIVVTYGDTLTNLNMKKMREAHLASNSEMTIAIGRPSSRFGEVEIDQHGKVLTFKEKDKSSILASIGVFIIQKSFLRRLNSNSILEEEPIRNSVSDGAVSAYVHEGFWMPLDTNREYETFLELNKMPIPPWKNQDD
jgi:glucose-1-phosphate cytidylyltransferase